MGVKRILNELKRLEGPDGAYFLYAQAALLVSRSEPTDARKMAEARGYLARAVVMRPHWGRIYSLEASIYDREQKLDAAVEKYKAALDAGET